MKWCSYRTRDDGATRVGVLGPGGEEIHGLRGVTLRGLLAADALVDAGRRASKHPDEVVPLDRAVLRPPVPRPPTFRDFMSFEAHLTNAAGAMGLAVPDVWYDAPAFYFSNPATLLGPAEPVVRPARTTALDYELEVGVVVGRGGTDLEPHRAQDHIAGYLVICDWSARDVQRAEIPLTMGPSKSKDFATSTSGFLVTPDEVDTLDLRMTAAVDGVVLSEGTLADLSWSFGDMLAAASRDSVIVPGDLIGSGTVGSGCILELAGVHGADDYPYLEPGNVVRLEVDRIGHIESQVVQAPDPS